MEAVASGQVDVVRLLLERGADVKIKMKVAETFTLILSCT